MPIGPGMNINGPGVLVGQHAVSEQEAVGKRLLYEQAVQQWRQAQREHALLLAGAWKPDLAIARAAVEQADTEVNQISTEIERATVRAPIDGQVLQVNLREGERVNEQSSQALMLLGRLHPLHVRADIDEHDIAEFRARRPGRAAIARQERSALCAQDSCGSSRSSSAKRWLTGDNTERRRHAGAASDLRAGRPSIDRFRRPAGRRVYRCRRRPAVGGIDQTLGRLRTQAVGCRRAQRRWTGLAADLRNNSHLGPRLSRPHSCPAAGWNPEKHRKNFLTLWSARRDNVFLLDGLTAEVASS